MADTAELTIKQAAAELGIAERTCRKWLQDGKLEGRKVVKGQREVWRVSAAVCRKLGPDIPAAESAASGRKSAAQLGTRVLDEVRSLREENAEYRQAIVLLSERVAGLELTLRRLLPAPAAEEPEPKRRGLWERLWRRRG